MGSPRVWQILTQDVEDPSSNPLSRSYPHGSKYEHDTWFRAQTFAIGPALGYLEPQGSGASIQLQIEDLS